MMRIGDDGEAAQASGRPGRERPRRGRACATIPCESANDLQDLRTTSKYEGARFTECEFCGLPMKGQATVVQDASK